MVSFAERDDLFIFRLLSHAPPLNADRMVTGCAAGTFVTPFRRNRASQLRDTGEMGCILIHQYILTGKHLSRQSGRLPGTMHNAAYGWGIFMNITRGLLRLWVVAAGLWVIFVGFFLYEDVANPYVTGKAFYFRKDISTAREQADQEKSRAQTAWSNYLINTPDGFSYSMTGSSGDDAARRVLAAIGTINFVKEPAMVERYTDAYRLLEEGTTRGVSEQIDVGVPDTMLFVGKSEPDTVKTAQAKQVYDIALRARNVVIAKKRTEALKSGAAFAVIPPLVFFLLGWLILWVARGFRAR